MSAAEGAAVTWVGLATARDVGRLERAVAGLTDILGDPDFLSHSMVLDACGDAGEGPLTGRVLTAPRGAVRAGGLPELCRAAHRLEVSLAGVGGVPAGSPAVHVGYFSPGQLVRGATRAAPHRIHLGRGVWAELVLTGADRLGPLPWTPEAARVPPLGELLVSLGSRGAAGLNGGRDRCDP